LGNKKALFGRKIRSSGNLDDLNKELLLILTKEQMKIDIHVHTKKVKSGDSELRNIDVDRFTEIIKTTDVKILAITNHNHFDLKQYLQFKESVDDVCQIWPGIEFDILEEERRAHLIVVVNPKNSETFSEKFNKLIANVSPDNFTIPIKSVVDTFDNLDAIYIAHYHSKKPNLTDKDVDELLSLVSNPKRVLKEATNSISAGIYIRHGHNSIYGSDVHNWNEYIKISESLPELRLPVESFEQFCLLLDKNDITIKTILDKKSREAIQIAPFGIAELINLDIYNDINIIFGSKGTGKTQILKELSSHYNGLGFKTNVYESNSRKLDDVYDLKGNQYSVDIESLGIDSCSNELASLKNATEKSITSLSAYSRFYSAEATNKISKNIKVDKFNPDDENSFKRSFEEIRGSLQRFRDFKKYFSSEAKLKVIIEDDLFNELDTVVTKILDKINAESNKRLIDLKSILLFNNLIKVFVHEISKKTGQPERPISTGFYEYASNRISIEKDVKKILENITKTITPQVHYVGDLGDKGKLYCRTTIIIQNGKFTDSKYNSIQKVGKTPQKAVASQIEIISKHIYSNTLFEKIAELKEIEGGDAIVSLNNLLLFNRHFTLNDQAYSPSNGESSMVLLHNELTEEKEIYLIDEPEKSLGNDYISDVIVPLIKERAKGGKKIIIATHDANIAVRTLPYNSIYREHDISGYYTYSGNPFSNSLVCNSKKKENLDWKLISMKTLEGGKSAFGERGKIYGNT
jgi:energy-coupling factor transporter ATP-binding protein EcfA2